MSDYAVTVFASSSPRTPRAFLNVAEELGRAIAEQGWYLVSGAGNSGCMGALNDACLLANGRTRGVILRQFHDDGLGHTELHDLQIADNMRERKRLLGVRTDAYIVLPGGPGTWEEFWEVAVERQIRTHQRPVVVINTDDFYRGFIIQAETAAANGLLYGPIEELFTVVDNVDAAIDLVRPAD